MEKMSFGKLVQVEVEFVKFKIAQIKCLQYLILNIRVE
jgi:hypothetical protein